MMPGLSQNPIGHEIGKLISQTRRPLHPILIVEDREENQMLLAGICDSLDVKYKIAENGRVALDLLDHQTFSIYIVDLMMPVMDGKSFIKAVKEKYPDSVILVQTAIDSSEEIINIMKLGVYDYLIKPINLDLFKVSLQKALEYRYLIDIERNLLKEESKELRDHLEWLNYKESARKNSGANTENASIFNLKTTLSQGSGFGAMATLIDTISQTSKRTEDGQVSIDGELFALLEENNNHTKSMLRGLDKAVEILELQVNLSKHNSSELIEKISSLILHFEKISKQKSITLKPPIFKSDYKLLLDIDLIFLALKEIILNALKYSPNNSYIDTFITVIDGYFCLSVKNKLKNDLYSNIPQELQKQLTLPFFRFHPPVEDVHGEEPFSLGLGLTMVEYIANKHNGMFFIRNAKDHTTEDSSLCTLAELFIPIQN